MSNIVERKKGTKKKYIFCNCEQCGEKYSQYRSWQRFCSSLCKFRAWDKKHPRTKQT